MIKHFFIFLLVAFLGMITVDSMTVSMIFLVYFLGLVILILTNKKDILNSKYIFNIYQNIFTFGLIYIYICYMYMISYEYQYLLAPDINEYFLPMIDSFLTSGSIGVAESKNWEDFNFFSRYQSGYFGYLIPFAYASSYLNANLYVSMQLSTLLISGLNGVLIYRLILVNGIISKTAYKYTLIICLFTVLFFYSTLLLRDMHVAFFYLLGIYLTFRKDFSVLNLIKIIIVILVSCTLRIETGLFLFTLVPIYLLSTLQSSRKKNIIIITSAATFLFGIIASVLYSSQIISIFSDNSEIYLESDKGSGVIGNLQKIPIAGSILSILYNATQPLPFWSKYTTDSDGFRPEAYNIMTFPLSFASLFNWIALFFIINFLINKKIRKKVSKFIPKPLLYQLVLGFVFLYSQSAVISQRRLMAYYVIFYILFYIIYTNITTKNRKELLFASFFSYSVMQIFALVYKI